MAKASWTGTLSMGLVSAPVELYTAVRQQDLSFKQLCPRHKTTIHTQRICSTGGEVVEFGQLVKGYPLADGKFIVVTDTDMEKAAQPLGKTFDIQVFVPEADLDPRFVHTTYFALPKPGSERPYVLLRAAIRRTGKGGVGLIALRTKQQMAVLRVLGPALVLQMMHWPDELLAPHEFDFPDGEPLEQELEMAGQLVDAFPTTLAAGEFADGYRINLERIIEAKARGEEVTFDGPAQPESADVIDLVSLLQQSLAARQVA